MCFAIPLQRKSGKIYRIMFKVLFKGYKKNVNDKEKNIVYSILYKKVFSNGKVGEIL